jgi:hypothetical protein
MAPQQLDIAVAKVDVISRPGSGTSGTKLKNEQNPIAFDAYFAHEALRRQRSTIVNDIQQCRNIKAELAKEGTSALARWILSEHSELSINHVDWLFASHMWRHIYNHTLEAVRGEFLDNAFRAAFAHCAANPRCPVMKWYSIRPHAPSVVSALPMLTFTPIALAVRAGIGIRGF